MEEQKPVFLINKNCYYSFNSIEIREIFFDFYGELIYISNDNGKKNPVLEEFLKELGQAWIFANSKKIRKDLLEKLEYKNNYYKKNKEM